jgi:glyoxylase-like metal-dependent hydrolase (beta-lactamase superfamily II)
MKRLHRPDLFCWSAFDESRNLDFHSLLWVRAGGNVAIDPLPLSPHDRKHLDEVGGVGLVVVTNSDHTRNAEWMARTFDARLAGPRAERDAFPLRCDLWLDDGDTPVPGLRAFALDGSKTPGELAFVLEGSTLVTGDLVRAHEGGRLTTLPAAKLRDAAAAVRSVRRLAALPGIEAVLVGDGWPIFRGGGDALRELADGLG